MSSLDVTKQNEVLLGRAERLYNEVIEVIDRAKQAREAKIEEIQKGPLAQHFKEIREIAEFFAGTDSVILRSVREAKPVLELIMRMVESLRNDKQPDIFDAEDYMKFKAVMMSVLVEHPEIMVKVSDAMAEYTNTRGVELPSIN